MNDRAWEDLVDMIDVKYGIDNHAKTQQPLEGSTTLTEQVVTIAFQKDGQHIRVQRISGPAVVDTKSHYAHRGAAQRVERIYDPEQLAHRVSFARQSADGSWQEMAPEALFAA